MQVRRKATPELPAGPKRVRCARPWVCLIFGATAGLCALAVYAWPRRIPLTHSINSEEWRSTGWIDHASAVDLTHLGLHTHQNKIEFDLRRLSLSAGTGLRIVVHSRYQTARPGIKRIESWVVRYTNTTATVLAPTRFADLATCTSPLLGKAYLRPDSYYCEVAWDKR